MRAAVLRNGEMVVDDLPEPVPGEGQVLVAVQACGICGSDLHFVHHGRAFVDLGQAMNGVPRRPPVDFERDVRMGHEFSAVVLEAGPNTSAPKPGTLVTSVPALMRNGARKALSFTNDETAAYGERMLLSTEFVLPVPAGTDPQLAAMTEPLAVGLHAVIRSGIRQGDGALVLGCGPVGLTVIAALRHAGIEPIVAADFSPTRRRTAQVMGAHVVVDPREEPAVEAWQRAHGRGRLFVFEAVGVPGMINAVMRDVPRESKIVVAGVCMEPDTIQPTWGVLKELTVQFVVAYDNDEFALALRHIADGSIDVSPMITGTVGLDGLAQAFADLANPEQHTKIVIDPNR